MTLVLAEKLTMLLMNFSVESPSMRPEVMKVLPVPLGPTMASGNSCWMTRLRKYSCLIVSDVGTMRLSVPPVGDVLKTCGRKLF